MFYESVEQYVPQPDTENILWHSREKKHQQRMKIAKSYSR